MAQTGDAKQRPVRYSVAGLHSSVAGPLFSTEPRRKSSFYTLQCRRSEVFFRTCDISLRTWDIILRTWDIESCALWGMRRAYTGRCERARFRSKGKKGGQPGRLTANVSLLATPSARLTVVERTPSSRYRGTAPCTYPRASPFLPIRSSASLSQVPVFFRQ